MKGQKTLEINPRHPLIQELKRQVTSLPYMHWLSASAHSLTLIVSIRPLSFSLLLIGANTIATLSMWRQHVCDM